MKKKVGLFLGALVLFCLALGTSVTHLVNATVPGINTLVSVNNLGNGQGGNGNSPYDFSGLNNVISSNGRFVAFTSSASNLVNGDTNGRVDAFVRDLVNNTTVRVDVSSSGVEANNDLYDSVGYKVAISTTGRYVVFPSRATNLIDGQTISSPQLYIRDTVANTTKIVSQTSSGALANAAPMDVVSVSSDGRFVAWRGNLSTNLVATETNTLSDFLYLTDLNTQTTSVLNHTPSTGQYFLTGASASCDGSLIAFSTKLQLVSSDTDTRADIYLADIRNGTTITGVTTASNSTGDALMPSISCNGDFVTFTSADPNIVTSGTAPTSGTHQYLYDRVNGSITLVDTSTTGVIGSSGVNTTNSAVDNKGDVFFSTSSPNLIDGYTVSTPQVYIKHSDTGVTEIVSKTPGGSIASGASYVGGFISSSADGKIVVYRASGSSGTTLLSSDTNGYMDVIASQTGL